MCFVFIPFNNLQHRSSPHFRISAKDGELVRHVSPSPGRLQSANRRLKKPPRGRKSLTNFPSLADILKQVFPLLHLSTFTRQKNTPVTADAVFEFSSDQGQLAVVMDQSHGKISQFRVTKALSVANRNAMATQAREPVGVKCLLAS